MSETIQETSFPVIFFDGEREFPMGHVKVFPMQVYKTFLYVVSQHVRVSPSQISIFLVDRKNLNKILISAKTSFSRVCTQQDCFLLVILKRHRVPNPEPCPVPGPYAVVPYHPLHVDMNYSLQFHQQLAQQYLNLNPCGLVTYNYDERFRRIEEAYPEMVMDKPVLKLKYCEECTVAEKNGGGDEFHHCVHDEIVKEARACGFGPIGPGGR